MDFDTPELRPVVPRRSAGSPLFRLGAPSHQRSKNLAAARNKPQGKVSSALTRNNSVANGVATTAATTPHLLLISGIAARGDSKKSR